MNKNLRFLIPIIILGLLFLYNCNFFPESEFGNLSEIIVACVSLIGLVQLFSTLNDLKVKRKRESNDYAFSIQDFFREKIWKTATEINKSKKLPIYKLKFIGPIDFNSDKVKSFDVAEYDRCINIIMADQDLLNSVTDLLNQIEQLSTKVVFSNNVDHPALLVITKAYCEIVEFFSPSLHKYINEYNYPFKYTIILYDKWK